jgi:hypothetical protein
VPHLAQAAKQLETLQTPGLETLEIDQALDRIPKTPNLARRAAAVRFYMLFGRTAA